jgi:8-oxo-dGTP pyrophosphatase MutT (NUDIX family)
MVSEKNAADALRNERLAWRARVMSRLNRKAAELDLREVLRPAAVLVPIVERAEPTVLLTLRTEHLPTHAGQISFPGGRYHATDASLTETALRELEEEVGIERTVVDLAGYLDPHETLNSGFLILPVVGFLRSDFQLRVNEQEVAEVFEAPLDFLVNAKNRGRMEVMRGGMMREYDTIQFGPHTIWGATAAMIFNLADRLREA